MMDCFFIWFGRVSLVLSLIWGLLKIYSWLWKPQRRGWSAKYIHKILKDGKYYSNWDVANELQRTLDRNNRRFWHSNFPQQEGSSYQITLDKERIISGFYEIDIERDNNVPCQYALRLYNRGGDKRLEPNHMARHQICGAGRVSEEFPPIKVQRIEIVITKANLDESGKPYLWKIYGFDLKEMMLLKHLGRMI